MRQAVLLGTPGTKRTVYLEKAAREAGLSVKLWDWRDFEEEKEIPAGWNKKEIFLKVDPPVWGSCFLEELEGLTKHYEEGLSMVERFGRDRGISFLNEPAAIRQLLDKRGCKERLLEMGVSVTEPLRERVRSGEELLEAMNRCHMPQVFLKPVKGSGAAGIGAFRYQRKTGQMILYTCGFRNQETGRLVNTKRLRRFTDRDQIMSYLNDLLTMDCMAERWYPKAEHQGYSYDLRAVVQEGKVDFVLARLSKGPITNLHLNNHPAGMEELGLSPETLEAAEDLCRRAAGCYEGLKSVGIDILLERGSLRPRVIEMNGQGDLIYQDIYNDNRIYRHQAEIMKEWLYGET